MFEQALPGNAKNSLAILGESKLLDTAYLAGGTALALQLGHRISVDFDFFTKKEFNEQETTEQLANLPEPFKLDRKEKNTILGFIGKTKFSLFFYNYPLLEKPQKFLNINIASLKDIAVMKLATIADRGTKRDFIDMYFIVAKEKAVSLQDILWLYDKKFKMLSQNRAHLLKSLTYFDDAEATIVPDMLKPTDWKEVKKFFEKETKRLAQQEF
ncbi:MAG: nucleotidyl transferase AbiEii/AbiGii toxin family protein [Candidatus Gribaldobacteria bacterium]|nr:nucleotidyl transferase AbiEii/AbiGii toxin family protein [Candidatus Gribaldobacteria bacterium]